MEITEVDHSKAKRLGVEWLDSISFAEKSPQGIISPGSFDRLTPLSAKLHFLLEEGAAEVLAKPNLLTESGATADFRAGGEIPYITTSALGSSHVEFKLYGVALKITPRLLQSGAIEVNLRASVSSPDQTNGVFLSGNMVPALLEREVISKVTVDQGTTITLAGLVQTIKEESQSGVPILRKIPVLGMLFRWKNHRYRRTSVIIFVTPRLVEL